MRDKPQCNKAFFWQGITKPLGFLVTPQVCSVLQLANSGREKNMGIPPTIIFLLEESNPGDGIQHICVNPRLHYHWLTCIIGLGTDVVP